MLRFLNGWYCFWCAAVMENMWWTFEILYTEWKFEFIVYIGNDSECLSDAKEHIIGNRHADKCLESINIIDKEDGMDTLRKVTKK